MMDWPSRLGETILVPAHGLEHAVFSFQRADGRLRHDLDVRQTLNAIHKVAGHLRAEVVAAHEEPHFAGHGRKVDYRLTCRVATSNDNDLLPGTELSFQGRRPVVNPGAFKKPQIFDFQPPVACTARDND